MLAALGCSGDGASDPTPDIDELFLSVATNEAEESRHLMVVGEVGSANVIAFRHSVGADPGQVVFTSSNPAVAAVSATSFVDAELEARTPGSIQIIATAQGLSDQVRVDVVATPPPVDRIQASLAPISSDVEATYDIEGNLVSITLTAGESAALDLMVLRNGARVTRIPFILTSSQPSTVRTDQHCRPPELDPQCDVFGNWGWVTGLLAGQSEVTVTVRNQVTTFMVNIE
jgi:hypothetical protein